MIFNRTNWDIQYLYRTDWELFVKDKHWNMFVQNRLGTSAQDKLGYNIFTGQIGNYLYRTNWDIPAQGRLGIICSGQFCKKFVQDKLGYICTGQIGIHLYRTDWEYLIQDKLGYICTGHSGNTWYRTN
jgi:hypothetical protein